MPLDLAPVVSILTKPPGANKGTVQIWRAVS